MWEKSDSFEVTFLTPSMKQHENGIIIQGNYLSEVKLNFKIVSVSVYSFPMNPYKTGWKES
jgi:hypothetical protein